MDKFLTVALHKDIVISSLKVALFVGTVLNLINQGDHLISLNTQHLDWFKLGLTYSVPYLVSTYASVRTKLNA